MEDCKRDYLKEALDIIEGKGRMLPERAHLQAIVDSFFSIGDWATRLLRVREKNEHARPN